MSYDRGGDRGWRGRGRGDRGFRGSRRGGPHMRRGGYHREDDSYSGGFGGRDKFYNYGYDHDRQRGNFRPDHGYRGVGRGMSRDSVSYHEEHRKFDKEARYSSNDTDLSQQIDRFLQKISEPSTSNSGHRSRRGRGSVHRPSRSPDKKRYHKKYKRRSRTKSSSKSRSKSGSLSDSSSKSRGRSSHHSKRRHRSKSSSISSTDGSPPPIKKSLLDRLGPEKDDQAKDKDIESLQITVDNDTYESSSLAPDFDDPGNETNKDTLDADKVGSEQGQSVEEMLAFLKNYAKENKSDPSFFDMFNPPEPTMSVKSEPKDEAESLYEGLDEPEIKASDSKSMKRSFINIGAEDGLYDMKSPVSDKGMQLRKSLPEKNELYDDSKGVVSRNVEEILDKLKIKRSDKLLPTDPDESVKPKASSGRKDSSDIEDEDLFLYGSESSTKRTHKISTSLDSPPYREKSTPKVSSSRDNKANELGDNLSNVPSSIIENPTIKNILSSIGFDFEMSKRMQDRAKERQGLPTDNKIPEGPVADETSSFLKTGLTDVDLDDVLFSKRRKQDKGKHEKSEETSSIKKERYGHAGYDQKSQASKYVETEYRGSAIQDLPDPHLQQRQQQYYNMPQVHTITGPNFSPSFPPHIPPNMSQRMPLNVPSNQQAPVVPQYMASNSSMPMLQTHPPPYGLAQGPHQPLNPTHIFPTSIYGTHPAVQAQLEVKHPYQSMAKEHSDVSSDTPSSRTSSDDESRGSRPEKYSKHIRSAGDRSEKRSITISDDISTKLSRYGKRDTFEHDHKKDPSRRKESRYSDKQRDRYNDKSRDDNEDGEYRHRDHHLEKRRDRHGDLSEGQKDRKGERFRDHSDSRSREHQGDDRKHNSKDRDGSRNKSREHLVPSDSRYRRSSKDETVASKTDKRSRRSHSMSPSQSTSEKKKGKKTVMDEESSGQSNELKMAFSAEMARKLKVDHENKQKRLLLLEEELESLRRQQNEIMRKRQREKDGHKDPILVANNQLQEEIIRQIGLIRDMDFDETIKVQDSEASSSSTTNKQFTDDRYEDSDHVRAALHGDPIKNADKPTKFRPVTDEETTLVKEKPVDKVKYEFFDPGNHWCSLCNYISSNVYDVFRHLQSKAHQQNVDPYDRPWMPDSLKNPPTDRDISSNVQVAPIKGVEFMMATPAFFCKLCCVFSGDATCADEHLKTEEHNIIYKEYIRKNPYYERRLNLDRAAGISRIHEQGKASGVPPPDNGVTTESTIAEDVRKYKEESEKEQKILEQQAKFKNARSISNSYELKKSLKSGADDSKAAYRKKNKSVDYDSDGSSNTAKRDQQASKFSPYSDTYWKDKDVSDHQQEGRKSRDQNPMHDRKSKGSASDKQESNSGLRNKIKIKMGSSVTPKGLPFVGPMKKAMVGTKSLSILTKKPVTTAKLEGEQPDPLDSFLSISKGNTRSIKPIPYLKAESQIDAYLDMRTKVQQLMEKKGIVPVSSVSSTDAKVSNVSTTLSMATKVPITSAPPVISTAATLADVSSSINNYVAPPPPPPPYSHSQSSTPNLYPSSSAYIPQVNVSQSSPYYEQPYMSHGNFNMPYNGMPRNPYAPGSQMLQNQYPRRFIHPQRHVFPGRFNMRQPIYQGHFAQSHNMSMGMGAAAVAYRNRHSAPYSGQAPQEDTPTKSVASRPPEPPSGTPPSTPQIPLPSATSTNKETPDSEMIEDMKELGIEVDTDPPLAEVRPPPPTSNMQTKNNAMPMASTTADDLYSIYHGSDIEMDNLKKTDDEKSEQTSVYVDEPNVCEIEEIAEENIASGQNVLKDPEECVLIEKKRVTRTRNIRLQPARRKKHVVKPKKIGKKPVLKVQPSRKAQPSRNMRKTRSQTAKMKKQGQDSQMRHEPEASRSVELIQTDEQELESLIMEKDEDTQVISSTDNKEKVELSTVEISSGSYKQEPEDGCAASDEESSKGHYHVIDEGSSSSDNTIIEGEGMEEYETIDSFIDDKLLTGHVQDDSMSGDGLHSEHHDHDVSLVSDDSLQQVPKPDMQPLLSSESMFDSSCDNAMPEHSSENP